MRFAAVRHAAGLMLALVWAVARLAQPLDAACPHHAPVPADDGAHVTHAADLTVPASAHAHHHVAGNSATPPAPEPAPGHHVPANGCDCIGACCAATLVAMPALAVDGVRPADRWIDPVSDVQPHTPRVHRWVHRQPPANAPPRSAET
jgi:hypothetical protein